jgi:phosphoglycolate phosphatase
MSFDFDGWTLVFDLDGTLVETAPDLHAALNHTLASKGLGQIPIETIRMMIGDGAKALIRKGLSYHGRAVDEDEIEATLWPTFIDHYLANITRLSAPFEGVIETLDALTQTKAILAVCTNKAQTLAVEVLAGLNLTKYFPTCVGGDDTPSQKPSGLHITDTITRAGGNPARAIMIGDSQTDERAARDAKLPFVFVTFGYGDLTGEPYPELRVINLWRDMSVVLHDLASNRSSPA